MSAFELIYVAAFFVGSAFALVTVFAEPRLPSAWRASRWLHPMKVSLFLAAWGAMGVIFLKWAGASAPVHLPLSVVIGLLLSTGISFILPKC